MVSHKKKTFLSFALLLLVSHENYKFY